MAGGAGVTVLAGKKIFERGSGGKVLLPRYPHMKPTIEEWYAGLRETTLPVFFPLYTDTHRYLVLKGGGGSGKSIFAGRKLLERVTSERGHRFLVVRKVSRTLRHSCYAQLLGQLAENFPHLRAGVDFVVNKSDCTIRFPALGSEILFSGIDDPEKLKSIYRITGIWIEEASELDEADFDQLDIRLRDATEHYQQIILTFNPISVTHWLKRRFFDRCEPRATVSETTYRDNPHLSREAVATLESFRETNPYYYTVYALGSWGVTGRTVFDARALTARLETLEAPVITGDFEYVRDEYGMICEWHLREGKGGCVRIYRTPERGHPYVIGADTAGEGSDACVAQVLDNSTGEQVATFRSARVDEDEFTRVLWCLGRYYNDALIGVETNFSTYPVRELERLRYPRQYVRESVDNYTHEPLRSFGFRTDAKTRPIIISTLVSYVRDHPEDVRDRETIGEMLTFVRTDSFRAEAEAGAHDDLVMALGIAHVIRSSQTMEVSETRASVEWSEGMLEDWRNASGAAREYLKRTWGPPPRKKR